MSGGGADLLGAGARRAGADAHRRPAPGEGISAVKALQKANQQGQRIYHITPANQASTLPNIHHGSLVMDEIRNALNAGKEVITHTDAVSVPGWKGAGYALLNPDSGDGAFKIAGGMTGRRRANP